MRTRSFAIAVIVAAFGVLALSGTAQAAAPVRPIQPVASVDVQRYLGTWKQIADIPQFYETFCERDTTAKYALNTDGTVSVVNTCTGPFGLPIKTTGAAKVLNPGSNSQLQVSFINLFGRQIFNDDGPNYVIIGLAADYSWAVVGSPDHKSAYILARTTSLTSRASAAAGAALVSSGFDPCSLITSPQAGGATSKTNFC